MTFPKPDYSDLPDYQANWASWADMELFVAQKLSPDLAIGFTSLLFPEFHLFDDCVFRSDVTSVQAIIEQWKTATKGNLAAVERVCNHVHIVEDNRFPFTWKLNDQNLEFFATVLKLSWKTSLELQFPDRTFIVDLNHDSDAKDYIITFWQPKHDRNNP
jgi:hypothetical protein